MEEILTPQELAGYLGVSPKTLSNWRSMRVGPVPLRARNVVRYRKRDVQAWLDEHAEISRNWMDS